MPSESISGEVRFSRNNPKFEFLMLESRRKLSQPLNQNGIVVFDFGHDKGRLDGAYRVDRTEFVEPEVAGLGHRGCTHFKYVVERSRHMVAFVDLGQTFDIVDKGSRDVAVDDAQFHLADDHEAAAEFVGIENRGVAAYIALGFETSHTLEDRSRRAVYLGGELTGGKTRIDLKGAEYVEVDGVEDLGCHVVEVV